MGQLIDPAEPFESGTLKKIYIYIYIHIDIRYYPGIIMSWQEKKDKKIYIKITKNY